MSQIKQDSSTEDLTNDDLDVLQQVLMKVRGSYPDSPYRQADFSEEYELDISAEA